MSPLLVAGRQPHLHLSSLTRLRWNGHPTLKLLDDSQHVDRPSPVP